MHKPILSILWLALPELWMTQSDHILITSNGHCVCAVSHDLCIGGPQITRNNLLTRIFYSLYNFYGATTKGSLYLSTAMFKRFSAAKTVRSKSVP